jgi:hypothetical protein
LGSVRNRNRRMYPQFFVVFKIIIKLGVDFIYVPTGCQSPDWRKFDGCRKSPFWDLGLTRA